jgi:hypothetical protein
MLSGPSLIELNGDRAKTPRFARKCAVEETLAAQLLRTFLEDLLFKTQEIRFVLVGK